VGLAKAGGVWDNPEILEQIRQHRRCPTRHDRADGHPDPAEHDDLSGSGRFRFSSSLDKPRRRFVQDGEVPVTVLNARPRHGSDPLGMPRPGSSPLERAEAAEAALEAERSARETAERQLREAQATILDLRTKQGHAELARREEDAATAAAREELAMLRMTLRERDEQLAELRLALTLAAPVGAPPGVTPSGVIPSGGIASGSVPSGAAPGVRRARGRPRKVPLPVEPTRDAEPTATVAAPNRDTPATPPRRGPGRPKGSVSASTVAKRGRPAAEPKPVKWWIKPVGPAKPAAKRGRPPGSGRKPRG
jgi:hypothetical protein